MRGPLSRAGEAFNYVEVALWPVIGVVVSILAMRRTGPARIRGLVAAVTLVAFGASDWAENKTGGEWWHPWWLLLWKAACVAVLLAVGFLGHRASRKARSLSLVLRGEGRGEGASSVRNPEIPST
jgi:hypothetical protein